MTRTRAMLLLFLVGLPWAVMAADHVDEVTRFLQVRAPQVLDQLVLPRFAANEKARLGQPSVVIQRADVQANCHGALQTARSHADANGNWQITICARPFAFLADFVIDATANALPIDLLDTDFTMLRARYDSYEAFLDRLEQSKSGSHPPLEACPIEVFAYEYHVQAREKPCMSGDWHPEVAKATAWYWSKEWATSPRSVRLVEGGKAKAAELQRMKHELIGYEIDFLMIGILAHEMGHAINGPDETGADQFAFELLSRGSRPDNAAFVATPYLLAMFYVTEMLQVEYPDAAGRIDDAEFRKAAIATQNSLRKALPKLPPEVGAIFGRPP